MDDSKRRDPNCTRCRACAKGKYKNLSIGEKIWFHNTEIKILKDWKTMEELGSYKEYMQLLRCFNPRAKEVLTYFMCISINGCPKSRGLPNVSQKSEEYLRGVPEVGGVPEGCSKSQRSI